MHTVSGFPTHDQVIKPFFSDFICITIVKCPFTFQIHKLQLATLQTYLPQYCSLKSSEAWGFSFGVDMVLVPLLKG